MNVPETPIGVPESFDEHAKLMFDLQVLAYQAEITRVSTFMLARDLSQRTFPQIGVPEPHHSVSHHGNNPVQIAKLEKINNYHVSLFGYFLEQAARHARRRRQPARSLHDHVRQLA